MKEKLPRSTWLIMLLYSPGVHDRVNEPIIGSIKIMKGLFLMCQEIGITGLSPYKFEPYLYGPMSFQVYGDINVLKMKGVIYEQALPNKTQNLYGLTYRGCRRAERIWKSIPASVKRKISEIKTEVNKRSFLSLLEYVYSKYPKFAKESVIRIPRPSK